MTNSSFAGRAAALAAAALLAAALAGCAGDGGAEAPVADAAPSYDTTDTSGGVAATVNGEEIGENAVTEYIADFRERQGLQDDGDWGQWLFDNGYTVDSLRGETIRFFESRLLLRQAARQEGLSVTQEEIDAGLAEAREAAGGDEAWAQWLSDNGVTEGDYTQQVELTLLNGKLREKIVEDVAADDADVLEAVQSYAEDYPGAKRSRQIVFAADDGATAQEVLDRINAGELTFDEAAEQYSLDREDGGDVGWDKLSAFEDEYQEALDGLEVGEMSGLVKSDTGIRIILCTDELVVPEGGVESLDQVSEGFVEYVRASEDEAARQLAFDTWMTQLRDDADIHEEYLPEDAPYRVDLAPYEEAAREAATAQSAGGGSGEEQEDPGDGAE